MQMWKTLKKLAGNLCIICSAALCIIFVLDWYNPFMDFLGHAKIVLYTLCTCSAFMGICSLSEGKKHTRKLKHRR